MYAMNQRANACCSSDTRSLSFWLPSTRKSLRHALHKFAEHLARAAQRELDLTPKPGLVDRHDNGSHPDLDYDKMRASVALLPEYYGDLLERLAAGEPLGSCIEAGKLAESRMQAKIRSNAHRGYIFLSGLALVGAHRAKANVNELPEAIAAAAREFFASVPREASHGMNACGRFRVGGIRGETEAGLPSVFAAALPRYAASIARDGDRKRAEFAALASLMQRIEDTTALHRCGLPGLLRLRSDGRALEMLLEKGRNPRAFLEERNEVYQQLGLTMGGVADCLAVTIALHRCFSGGAHIASNVAH